MRLRWWRRADHEPSAEAKEAVSDAQNKLLAENIRAQDAEIIAYRAEFLRRRNHFAEAAVAAMTNFGERP